MELVVAISNGFRSWGAASVLFSLPVLGLFLWNAFRGAIVAWQWELELSTDPRRWRAGLMALIALWREGETAPTRVNLWVIVLLMAFLLFAGSGIFIALNFYGASGGQTPWLTVLMMYCWGVLAVAGWLFTVSTARSVPGMAIASLLLLITFMGVSLQLRGFV